MIYIDTADKIEFPISKILSIKKKKNIWNVMYDR